MSKTILNRILTKRDMTVYQLSKITSISTSRIYGITKGKTVNPRIDTLIKIAKALNLTNDEFIELCGYKSDKQD